jgi:hypothetical protein
MFGSCPCPAWQSAPTVVSTIFLTEFAALAAITMASRLSQRNRHKLIFESMENDENGSFGSHFFNLSEIEGVHYEF